MKTISFLFIMALAIFSCTPPSKEEIRLGQYKVQGQRLFMRHCSNCHQSEGEGLGKLFPPIAKTDYVTKENLGSILCMMRDGLEDKIVVNGITYNQKMPGVPQLTDIEVAEIATYVFNSWGNELGLIDVSVVEKNRKNCEK